MDRGFGEPFQQRELAGRLRILGDVHKQLADFLEDAADVKGVGDPCDGTHRAREIGSRIGTAAETDKGST